MARFTKHPVAFVLFTVLLLEGCSTDAPTAKVKKTEQTTDQKTTSKTTVILDAEGQSVQVSEDGQVEITFVVSASSGETPNLVIDQEPLHGTLTQMAGLTYRYVPAANYHGTDVVEIHSELGGEVSKKVAVTITVTPVNDAPEIGVPTGGFAFAGFSYSASVTGTDIDGDSLTLEIAGAEGGAATVTDASNLAFRFDLAADFAGDATLAVRVADAGLASAWQVVRVRTYESLPFAAGANFSCQTTGPTSALYCWGQNVNVGRGNSSTGPFTRPVDAASSMDQWAYIAAGNSNLCAINGEFQLYCWGQDQDGQVGDGVPDTVRDTPTLIGSGWKSIAGWSDHFCGIKLDDTLWCWGKNSEGSTGIDETTEQVDAPVEVTVATVRWAQVSTGYDHTCAVSEEGELYCWGGNVAFQQGHALPATHIPGLVNADTDWRKVVAGDALTCALKTSGTLWCWGKYFYGELGQGNTDFYLGPVRVGSDVSNWGDLAMQTGTVCATRTDGSLWCWGQNYDGAIGSLSADTSVLSPTQAGGAGWRRLVANQSHACGSNDAGILYCWGSNINGALGTQATVMRPVPTAVAETALASLDARYDHACGLNSGGELWCWGLNGTGAFGNSDYDARSVPSKAVDAADWSWVATGDQFTCATKTDGTLWCSGTNIRGQLGSSTGGSYQYSFVQESLEAAHWRSGPGSMSGGERFFCAIATDDKVYCWGDNTYGQLAADSSTVFSRSTPTPVSATTDWQHVAAGKDHACAIKTGGTLWCWGSNGQNQLGTGGYSSATCGAIACMEAPYQVGTATDWSLVAAGRWRTCGLRGDLPNATLWCWGNGAVGSGLYGSSVPVQEATGATNWTNVAVGQNQTCAERADDSVWCFASAAYYGEAGIGFQTASLTPVEVLTGTSLASGSLSLGEYHSLFLDTAGTVWGWGSNSKGLFGDSGGWTETPGPVYWP